MGYRSLSCGRPAAEQRYILAMLRVFAQLPPERREAVRALIACLAETPEEGRRFSACSCSRKRSEAGSRGAGVSPRKLSRLRKKFLEQMPCEYERRVRMKDKTALTARQKRFVEEYLACGDGPEAAIAAGYSPATAEERARELLRDPAVQRCRRESEQRLFDAMGVSSAWIGRRLVEIVDRCMQATPHLTRNPETKQREPDGIWEFDPAGAMRALHELDEHLRALREEEAEDGALSLEEWLAQQEGASAL